MSNPFNIPELNPEQLAKQQRYSNWLNAVSAGWHYAEKMNCREPDRYAVVAKTLADVYFKHLQEGEKLLSA